MFDDLEFVKGMNVSDTKKLKLATLKLYHSLLSQITVNQTIAITSIGGIMYITMLVHLYIDMIEEMGADPKLVTSLKKLACAEIHKLTKQKPGKDKGNFWGKKDE